MVCAHQVQPVLVHHTETLQNVHAESRVVLDQALLLRCGCVGLPGHGVLLLGHRYVHGQGGTEQHRSQQVGNLQLLRGQLTQQR